MKKILFILLFAIGVFLVIDAAMIIVWANFTIGVILEIGLGTIFILWSLFNNQITAFTQNSIGRIIKIIFISGLAFVIGVCTFLGIYGNTDTVDYNEDVIIVLGCGVNGTVPTLALAQRLEIALEYEQKNPSAYIAVTGGQGPQEDISEAQCMSDYLTERGINPEKIIAEDKSTSTNENFLYTKKILDEKLGNYKAAVITNDFHIFRAKQLARLNGLNVTTIHAQSPFLGSAMMYLREILAVGKLIILRK